MELLEKATRYASKKQQKGILTFGLCIYGIFVFAVLELVNIEDRTSVAVILIIILIIIRLIWSIRWIVRKSQDAFTRSRAFKDLDHLGYTKEFLDTIDSEMRNNLIIKYRDSVYHLNLFVTSTWLIFISANGSIIRKVTDISKIYREFSPSRSRSLLNIEFIDGSVFTNCCDNACDDIINLFEKTLPSVVSQP